MKKVYIKHHPLHAGKWIYQGYYSAWKSLEYDVQYYSDLSEIKDENFYLMSVDSDLSESAIEVYKRSINTFLFVRPNYFPNHWGRHPNFVFDRPSYLVERLHSMDNVVKWTFCETENVKYFSEWGRVATVPHRDRDWETNLV